MTGVGRVVRGLGMNRHTLVRGSDPAGEAAYPQPRRDVYAEWTGGDGSQARLEAC
jgi:hypothetical protein